MKKKKTLFLILIIVSFILFLLSITVLDNTKIIAPVFIVISIYLFLGALIELCKMNDKLKNNIICMIDLLFWIP